MNALHDSASLGAFHFFEIPQPIHPYNDAVAYTPCTLSILVGLLRDIRAVRRLTLDDLSSSTANGDYDEKRKSIVTPHASNPTSSIRQAQVFHGYPNFPSNSAVGASNPPPLQDGMGSIGAHGGPNHTAVAAAIPLTEEEECNNALFGDLPEAKRRKFILVEDPAKNGTKVRVRVALEAAAIGGMPDSSRQINSVYPRSFFPKGMPTPAAPSRRNRFFDNDDPKAGSKDDGQITKGRTLVPIPVLDGEEREAPVPRIARGKQTKERLLNDLGYRMAWNQIVVFHSRKIFLQKARMYGV